MIELRFLDASLDIRDRNITIYEVGAWGVILLSLFVFGFPIYWMFISSIQPSQAIISFPPNLVPVEITLANWERLFFETQYPIWLKNSIIIAVGDVIVATVLATLAGYAFTRFDIPLKKWLARIFIFGYMFPKLTLGVPYFVVFTRIGLYDTLPALIISHQAVILPFTTWIMWQFFQTVPISLEEAAWVYGASRTKALFEIALPSALPGIMATAIFAFSIGWSDFTFALMLTATPTSQPLTVGIQSFMQQLQIYWGNLMAASAGLVLPPFLVVLLLNRYILAGFTVRSE
jgi:multiple sugar transport system permease protein